MNKQTLDLNKMGLAPMSEFEMIENNGGGFFDFLGDVLTDILTVVGAAVGFCIGGPAGTVVGVAFGYGAAKIIKAYV